MELPEALERIERLERITHALLHYLHTGNDRASHDYMDCYVAADDRETLGQLAFDSEVRRDKAQR